MKRSQISSRLRVTVGLATAIVAAIVGGSARADGPPSFEAAKAAGDPAAFAPTTAAPTRFSYHGKAVSAARARAASLACVQRTATDLTCFASAGAAEAALGYNSPAARFTSSSSRSTAGRATPNNHIQCFYAINWLWTGTSRTGYAESLDWLFGRWYNVSASMNNNAESYFVGEYGAHYSEHYDGQGYWYPGPTTSPCANGNNMAVYAGWANRVSARYVIRH